MAMYCLGWPLWRVAARLGLPIGVVVMVGFDKEAGVYVATTAPGVGLTLEAESLDKLKAEIDAALLGLVKANYPFLEPIPPHTEIQIRDCLVPA